MQVVMRRSEWLAAVIDGDEEKVAALVDKVQQDAKKEEVSDTASSRDLGALIRVGPCPGYENLKPLAVLRAMTVRFRECMSAWGHQGTTGRPI